MKLMMVSVVCSICGEVKVLICLWICLLWLSLILIFNLLFTKVLRKTLSTVGLKIEIEFIVLIDADWHLVLVRARTQRALRVSLLVKDLYVLLCLFRNLVLS